MTGFSPQKDENAPVRTQGFFVLFSFASLPLYRERGCSRRMPLCSHAMRLPGPDLTGGLNMTRAHQVMPNRSFFHHLKTDGHHTGMAALVSDEVGLLLEWDALKLPYLTQWKNTRRGI